MSNKHPTRVYTNEEIHKLTTEGYLLIHASLWDHIPKCAHIRYMKVGTQEPGVRFKPGGFVKSHINGKDGPSFVITTSPSKSASNSGNVDVSFVVPYKNIEYLWKKYDYSAYIEVHLIHNSLARKDAQIVDLNDRVRALESMLKVVPNDR